MNPRLAKIVTDLLAPWVVILGITAFVAVRAHAVWYGLILMVTASLAPITVIAFGVAADKLSDIHVGRREQRKAIFVMLVLLVGGTTAWFALTSAPSAMTALATTMLAVVGAAGLITVIGKFKISMHTAVASGTVVIACTEVRHDVVAAAATAVVGAAIVVLIGLARVVIKGHVASQAWAGAGIGTLCAAATFVPLVVNWS